jgi:hypothetical protein
MPFCEKIRQPSVKLLGQLYRRRDGQRKLSAIFMTNVDHGESWRGGRWHIERLTINFDDIH